MSDGGPVTFFEEGVPTAGITDAVEELVDLYGGELTASEDRRRTFVLPLRRGVSSGGAVQFTLSWTEETGPAATVTLTCDRDVDAPRAQRVLMLATGVTGALLFTIWPFFPQRRELGALAWIGGAVAIAVYLLTLRKTSGGIAFDFFRRLVERQRGQEEEAREPE